MPELQECVRVNLSNLSGNFNGLNGLKVHNSLSIFIMSHSVNMVKFYLFIGKQLLAVSEID